MQIWARVKLGITADEFYRMSWPDFDKAVTFWMEEQDRQTHRFAVHLAQMVNLKVDPKKRSPFKPDDFYGFMTELYNPEAPLTVETPGTEDGSYINPLLLDQMVVHYRSEAKAQKKREQDIKDRRAKARAAKKVNDGSE